LSPLSPMQARQASLFDCPVTAAVTALAQASAEERGAVYTRREVVEFLMDLTGYTADRPLNRVRLLEPSFGGGDFLIPAIERLLRSTALRSREALRPAIRAVELHEASFGRTKARMTG
jgi:type I restriction-modification system DNA methylase subunit